MSTKLGSLCITIRSVKTVYRVAGCPLFRDSNVLKSMGKLSGHSELSIISWVSAAEGRLLCGIPLYTFTLRELKHEPSPHLVYTCSGYLPCSHAIHN